MNTTTGYRGDKRLRDAILMMTVEQSRLSWIREQQYNHERGWPAYDRLIDAAMGKVVARVEAA